MGDCVGTVVPQHEFGYMGFSFAFVVAAAVFGGKHQEVPDLINILWGMVFIGVVCLTDFGSKEVVLSLLDIECDMGYDLVGSGLFRGGICTEWD